MPSSPHTNDGTTMDLVHTQRQVDMRQIVERTNTQAQTDLVLVGVAELGETGGAAFVEWPDGRHSVVTTATVSATAMHQTAEVLRLARAEGLPVPRHELIVELQNGVVAVVQERLSGRHPDRVDADVIDRLVAVNDRFAGILAGRPEVPLPALSHAHLKSAAPEHRALERYSASSRRLLRQICFVGHHRPYEMSGDDLVHPDYTVSNVLFDEHGRLTGVIDWNNGAFRGDRRFALVKLLFDLTWEATAPSGGQHHVQPSALTRLEQILHETVEATLLRAYWAHWTLTMLDWTIRSGDAEVIDLHLRLGERGLH